MNTRKYGPEKTPCLVTFHAVSDLKDATKEVYRGRINYDRINELMV